MTHGSRVENSTLLAPLKAPKSYGTYSKQQQEEVINFIRDGNSLRTAEKVFGIPKSTMHCWLKKMHNNEGVPSMTEVGSDHFRNDDHIHGTSEKPVSKVHPFTSQHDVKEKPRTQIVIEEAELIRFLQTNEGAELIAKSYNIGVEEFHGFIQQMKYQNKNLRGLLVTPGHKKQVEVVGFVHEADNDIVSHDMRAHSCSISPRSSISSRSSLSPHASEDIQRKRSISDSDDNKIKVENDVCHHKRKKINYDSSHDFSSSSRATANVNLTELVSLLTNNPKKSDTSNNLGLTPEQLLTATKLINSTQPGMVNTYLATKPLIVTGNLMNPTDVLVDMKESPKPDQAELSPTYPKIVTPVSIKTEHVDMDYMMTSPHTVQSAHEQKFPGRNRSRLQNPLKSTKSGSLNLNEINRTQSEKELMALVDEEDVSADELCAEFRDSLDMNNWVDNEAWYNHQYLQHFQVSPATSSTSKQSDFVQASVSSEEREDDFESTADGSGITFASVPDKERVLSYLSDGNTVEDAERVFNVPQSTIQFWKSNRTDDVDSKPTDIRHRRFESAFYKPSRNLYTDKSYKSAFSKSAHQ